MRDKSGREDGEMTRGCGGETEERGVKWWSE